MLAEIKSVFINREQLGYRSSLTRKIRNNWRVGVTHST